MRYVGPRHIVIDDMPVIPEVWQPDKSFEGLPVVLVGGGPSHADIDLATLSRHRFIAINSACRKVRPAASKDDILYFTDNAWNENRPTLAAEWPGLVVTCNRRAKIRNGDAVRYIDVLALTAIMGTLPDHSQASSGHIAACLAAVMGAAKLILVGFECREINGRTHGHDDYRQQDVSTYSERFLPGWKALSAVFARMGVEVVNATPESAIKDFPFVPFAQAT